MFVERFVECLPNNDLTYFIMKANLKAGVNMLKLFLKASCYTKCLFAVLSADQSLNWF